MSKHQMIILGLIGILILGLNLMPIDRGQKIGVCYSGGSDSFTPTVRGLPLGYYQYVKGSLPCANLDDFSPNAPASIDYGKGEFDSAALKFDVAIGGGILLATYFLFRQKGNAK